MTEEEAKKNQAELSAHYNLSYWYGTSCKKCCGVYPKLMTTGATHEQCYFQCEVCSRRTEAVDMPWISKELWNEDNTYIEHGTVQISLFE